VIGTGKIGTIVARVLASFGCMILAHDVFPNAELEASSVRYVDREEIFSQADIITLHCPLMPETHHLINDESLSRMKRGVMLINTSRGALVDSEAVVRSLKSGKLGSLGMDVYEEEADLFFEDLSNRVIQDDVFSRMLTFPNVVITGHQAYFTHGALEAIARETIENITAFERGETPPGLITAELVRMRT
jgi:D-lactate dehydrogenase